MATKLSANSIKNLLLAGQTVKVNKCAIRINANDEVEIWPSKGRGFVASLLHLNKAVKQFMKMADLQLPGEINESMGDAVSVPDNVLGEDTTTDEPFDMPEINEQVKPSGEMSSTDLGKDTTTKNPFENPAVNKRPKPDDYGMPSTELGSDSSTDGGFEIPSINERPQIPDVKMSDTSLKSHAKRKRAAFMEPQVWEGDFIKLEGDNGTTFIPNDVIPFMDEEELEEHGETLQSRYGEFYEGSEVYEVEAIHGWGAQMSAPGYMDQTDLVVFDTEEEAVDYLFEYYMTDMGELDPEYEEYREEYEEFAKRQGWEASPKVDEDEQFYEGKRGGSKKISDTKSYAKRKRAFNVPIEEVDFDVNAEPEDMSPEGAFAMGEEPDAEIIDWIYNEQNRGNEWAWCQTQVIARWEDENGKEYTGKSGWLGGCSYKSEEDFRQEGGYFDDMKNEAYEDLLMRIQDSDTGLKGIRPASRKISDTFSQEKAPSVYQEIRANRPSKALLDGILDADAWTAKMTLGKMASDPFNVDVNDRPNQIDQKMSDPELTDEAEDIDMKSELDKRLAQKKANAFLANLWDQWVAGKRAKVMATLKKLGSAEVTKVFVSSLPEKDQRQLLKQAQDYGQMSIDQIVADLDANGMYDPNMTLQQLLDTYGQQQVSAKKAQFEDEGYGGRVEELVESWINGNRTTVIEEILQDTTLALEVYDALPESERQVFKTLRSIKMGRSKKAGPKLREKWDDKGGYNRDIEAESAEELHALVNGLSGEEVDWSIFRKDMVNDIQEEANPEGQPEGMVMAKRKRAANKVVEISISDDAAGDWGVNQDSFNDYLKNMILSALEDGFQFSEEIDFRVNVGGGFDHIKTKGFNLSSPGTGGDEETLKADIERLTDKVWEEANATFEPEGNSIYAKRAQDKEAVDEKAKDYYKGYFGDYGKELAGDKSVTDKRPKGKDKKEVEKKGQAAPMPEEEAMPAPPAPAPGGAPSPKAPGAPAPGGAPPKAVPPKAPAAPAAGTGNDGLMALGWTQEEIQLMDDEDKQKILSAQIHKPGTKPKKAPKPAPAGQTQAPGGAAPQAPAPAPAGPPVAPGGQAPMPEQPKPMTPAAKRKFASQMVEKLRVRKAQQMLQQDVPVTDVEKPQRLNLTPGQPKAPGQAPAPQAPAPQAPEEAPAPGVAPMELSDESQAYRIVQEIQMQQIQASAPEQVPISKASLLAERLINDLGMTISEAKKLFGVQSLSALFK